MGLPWIKQIPIDWSKLLSANWVKSVNYVNESDEDFLCRMQQKFPEPFSDKYGVIKSCELLSRLIIEHTPPSRKFRNSIVYSPPRVYIRRIFTCVISRQRSHDVIVQVLQFFYSVNSYI